MSEGSVESIRVLLVEDMPGDAGLAKIALRDFRKVRMSVVWSQTLKEAIELLGTQAYDIVLLDLTLPDSIGTDTLKRVKNVVPQTPVIVLTGQNDPEFGLTILRAGAADYLVKGDFGYDGLARTVFYTLHRASLEKELADYRFHLEELVAARTAELALAKEAAEAANRAKTAFLANMSHELCTPLNAILGFAQLMERDPAIAESHLQELQTINRSGRQLLALINNVLEIASIEAGRITKVNKTFDLNALLNNIENATRPRAESKGLAFSIMSHGELPVWVIGDPLRLKQVLMNLLGNAVKYTDHGQVCLDIGSNGDSVTFEVKDSGPGIATDSQDKVFQAFYQINNNPALGEGAGLGLTLAREFVRLMGGELRLESCPGKGSRFYFSLPLPETDNAVFHFPDIKVVGLQHEQPLPRILIADEFGDNRDWLVRTIGGIGFDVKVAENESELLERFNNWQPHLIWIAENLPPANASESSLKIRRLSGGDLVKIICQADANHIDESENIPFDVLASLPVDESQVFRILAEQLSLQVVYAEPEPLETETVELDLSSLDRKMRLQIKYAAEALDIDSLFGIVEQLKVAHPAVAETLSTLTRNFRFDRIKLAADIDTDSQSR
ncbi:MAG: ATP-binding protein [Gammaproteobacteria bacterium]